MPNSRISDLFQVSNLDQDLDAEALLLIARAKSHNETMHYQDFKKSITDYCVFITGDQLITGLKTFEDNTLFNKDVSIQGDLSVRGDIFNLKFEQGVDPAFLNAWQSVIYPANAEVSYNSKSWRSSFQTLPSDQPGVTGTASQGKVTIDNHDHILNGDMVNLITPDGSTHGFIENQDWSVGANKEASATNLANAINSNPNFSATSDINSNEIIITQTTIGIAGNTTIMIDTANPLQISKEDFSGGLGSASNPWLDVSLKDADDYLTQLDSNLNTQGNLVVESDSHLKGILEVDGDSDIYSNLTVHKDLTVQQDSFLNSKLSVNTTDQNEQVTIHGNIGLTDNFPIRGTGVDLIYAEGTSAFLGNGGGFEVDTDKNTFTYNNASIANDLIVSGDAHLSQNLTILKHLNVKENSHLEGELLVEGITQLNDNLTVTASEARFIVDNAVFEKDVEIQGDLSVKGDLFNLKFDDGSGGNADNYLTQLDSNLVTKGTLSVDLDSTLKSNLNTQGDVTFDQKLDIIGQTTILDKLGVGTTSPQKTLEVAGDLRTTKTTADGGVLSLDLNPGGVADHPKLSLYDKNGGNAANLLYSRLQFTRDAEAFISSKSDLKLVTNGEDRITITADGNVGIGTSAPSEKLDVLTSNPFAARFSRGGGAPHIKFEDTSDSGDFSQLHTSNKMFLFSRRSASDPVSNQNIWLAGIESGNVGIGTADPSAQLEVASPRVNDYAIKTTRADGTRLTSMFQDNNSNGTIGAYDSSDIAKVWLNTNGASYFNGGNVGIGTAEPSQTLDVVGNFVQNDASGAQAYTNFFNYGGGVGVSVQSRMFNEQGDNNVAIRCDGDSFFNGGNVGIGTTQPDQTLTVKPTTNGKYGIHIFKPETDQDSLGGIFVESDGTSSLYLKDRDVTSAGNGQTTTRIKARGDSFFLGGNVGIGDSSPECKLDVEQDYAGTVFRVGGTSAVGNEFQVNSTQENPYVLLRGEGSDPKVALHSSGHSYFRGGNVGIGTVSPDFKLQIKGLDDLFSLENKNTGRTFNQGINNTEAYLDFSTGDNFEIKQAGVTALKIYNGGNIEFANDLQVNNNLTVQNDLTVRGDIFNIKFENDALLGSLPIYQSHITYTDGERIQHDNKAWDKIGTQGHPDHQAPGIDLSQWQEFIIADLDDYKTHLDSDLIVVGKTGLGEESPAAKLHLKNYDNTLPIFIAESNSKHLEIENDGDVIIYNKLKIGPRDGIGSPDSFQIYQDDPAAVAGDEEYFSIKHTTQISNGPTGGMFLREDGRASIGTWSAQNMLNIDQQTGVPGIGIYSQVSERATISLKESGAISYLETGSTATLPSSLHDLYGTNIGYMRSVEQDLAVFSSMNGTGVHIGAGDKKLLTFTGTTDSHPVSSAEAGNDVLFSEDANVGINVSEVALSPVTQDKFKLHVDGEVKIDGRLFATDIFETYPVIPKVGDVHMGDTVLRPDHSYSAGDQGTLFFDDDYIFICVRDSDGTDPNRIAWKRFAISEW